MEPAALDIILIIVARQRFNRNEIGFVHLRRSMASTKIISTVRIEAGTTVSGVNRFKRGLIASALLSCGKNKIERMMKNIGWN